MANNASLPKPVEEMVKSSKVDPSSKISSANSASSKDETLSNATSCISSVDVVCNSREVETDREHLFPEQSVYYPTSSLYGYYYPGIEMPVAELADHGYYMGPDRLETQQPVLQTDAGPYVYYVPGFQPGYDPYNSFVPPPMVGVDGQYLGQQPYFPCPVMSQPLGSPLYFPPVNYGPEMMQAYGRDSPVWYGNSGNGFVSDLSVPTTKPKFPTKSQPSKPSSVPKVIPVETKGSSPVLGLPPRAEVPNQSLKPVNKPSPPTKGYFPVAKLPPYTYQGKGNLMYSSNPINTKENGRSWINPDKVKGRNKPNGFSNFDSLTEQNRGPRTSMSKSTTDSEGDHVEDEDKEHENENESGNKSLVIRRDDYNLPDFPTKYEHASFFVIKSYSEDDIHKSIKYNVWASTPNGNKRLDSAFQAAQEKTADKGVKCPVFLFFSVNASGQFCGFAEMLGRVDFHKSMDFWQQDKWNGFFPVKWHIIKDVPNPQFRHIILENNENKPVTNSRDTQEVKFPQGSEMLNIFKNFSSKTSILDDFGFYENRQKVMQDKRAKFSSPLEPLLPKTEESIQTKKAEDLQPIIAGIEAMELGSTELNKDKLQPTAVA